MKTDVLFVLLDYIHMNYFSVYRCTDKDSKNNNQWISSLISVIKSQFQTSDYMSQWLHNIQKLSS